MYTYTILFLTILGSLSKGDAVSIINTLKCYLADINYALFGTADPYINYLFYSRQNPSVKCDLQPTTEALKTCKFNSSLETKVLLHGWTPRLPYESFFFSIKDAILETDNVNVIVVNWTSYTQNTEGLWGYTKSAFDSIYVGRKVAGWVSFLQKRAGADPRKFHFIPFSMGSEVTSFASKTICHLKHITFLDPAGPLFRFLPWFLAPSTGDAELVEAIHTDAASFALQGYGFKRAVADIDYYPNGGNEQPQCKSGSTFYYADGTKAEVKDKSTSISCKHNSAVLYYLASIDKKCQFLGRICKSYDDFWSGKCSSRNATVCRMGYYSKRIEDLPVHSKCYLQTSANPPYCLN